MSSRKLIFSAVVVFLILMTSAASTEAITQRAFVSGTGDDINIASDCPRTSPCRTFNVAIGAVIPGGELIALDTAGYGGIVNINKEITIAAIPGEMALVAVNAGTAGFTVNAAASDQILLRNISFNGLGALNTTGVQHNSGSIFVENCSFTRLTFAGLAIASGAFSRVNVINSIFVGNHIGLFVTSGAVNTENCTFIRSAVAIWAEGQGPDQDPITGGTTPRLTVVRVSNGEISSNTTAFLMANPGVAGTRPSGGCNAQNIFVRNLDGTGNGQPNIVGNPSFLLVTGTADLNGGCSVNMGSYSSQQANGIYVANQ